MSVACGRPVDRPFWTRGTRLLLLPLGLGLVAAALRLLFGLSATTNLSDQYPWGIWVAVDIAAGIALAAGGFTATAFIEIFGRERFRPLLRSALVATWLAYLAEAVVLVLDLGRYWNIWRVFTRWQGNSVLFAIALCVASSILVLTVELAPAFAAGLRKKPRAAVSRAAAAVIPVFLLAGVVLSLIHQSSLGTLLVIAPAKIHPLWYTPWLPVLFLLSAAMVGFPMVIIQYLAASRSFGRRPDMDMLSDFAAKVPWLVGAYGAAKVVDLAVRFRQVPWLQSKALLAVWLAEVGLGVVAPFLMLIRPAVRRSPRRLFRAALLLAGGVVLNRIDVFLVAYRPPHASGPYFPALGEIALTAATVSAVVFFYRLLAIRLPILEWDGATACQAFPEVEAPAKKARTRLWGGLAVAVLLGISAYATVMHRHGRPGPRRPPAAAFQPGLARERAREAFPVNEFFPRKYQDVYTLENPGLSGPDDGYGAVLFTHRRHDVNAGGNCAACHHRQSTADGDRTGVEFYVVHRAMGTSIQGDCQSCHVDLREKRIQKCSDCHRLADETDDRSRPGLLGAFHANCIGCHLGQPADKAAPTGCDDCHQPRQAGGGR